MRRGWTCTGYAKQDDLIFRNENAVAQRNSKRARRERRHVAPMRAAQQKLFEQSSNTSSDSELFDPQAINSLLRKEAFSEPSGPLKRDLAARAVERLFVDWILAPHKDTSSPGHMHDLPQLYYSSPDSILCPAVDALAFAHLKGAQSDNLSFKIRARRSYGAALSRLRDLAGDDTNIRRNEVLAALLLIDSFEVGS